jgi:4-hydroxymandelate oxidase
MDEARLITLDDFRRVARARLPKMAWDYIRSGADQQRSLRDNRRAFARFKLWPRVLVDVGAIDMTVALPGAPKASPILIAPTAYHQLAHPEGERATARAAARAGVVYVVSTLATTSLEDVAQAAPEGVRWFQLYVHRDRGLTAELVERAARAGYRALVVTVDTPVLGRRLADERNGFQLPAGARMANFGGAALEPEAGESASGASGSSLRRYFAARHDPTLTWRDLEWLRSLSSLPILLKGILRADDARRAVEAGAAGVIVSNHGARQLDGVPATLDALADVAAAVGERACVLVDGGVRSGTDVLIALALGARAVLIGRPILWGLAASGEAGVVAVLEILRDELSRALALAGCPSVAAIDPTLVRRARSS